LPLKEVLVGVVAAVMAARSMAGERGHPVTTVIRCRL
jgi:hypothetical protein